MCLCMCVCDVGMRHYQSRQRHCSMFSLKNGKNVGLHQAFRMKTTVCCVTVHGAVIYFLILVQIAAVRNHVMVSKTKFLSGRFVLSLFSAGPPKLITILQSVPEQLFSLITKWCICLHWEDDGEASPTWTDWELPFADLESFANVNTISEMSCNISPNQPKLNLRKWPMSPFWWECYFTSSYTIDDIILPFCCWLW